MSGTARDRDGTRTGRGEDHPLPPRAFILDCFGRGGSNIVWNMIGSSPDVLVPSREWHQGVFGQHHRLRKTMRAMGRVIDWNAVPGFTRIAAARTARTISPEAWAEKPDATATVLKVMGFHIVFASAIEAGFAWSRHIVLMRHPLPMCESLIRSGESEGKAAAIYNGIAANMAKAARRPDTLSVRFEDMIADPASFYRRLAGDLALPPPPDGLVRFMQKKYGAARTTADHGGRDVVRIAPEELRERIDANVNRDAVARLTAEQRRHLWQATAGAAAALGYGETDF